MGRDARDVGRARGWGDAEKRRRCTEGSAEKGHQGRHKTQVGKATEHGEEPVDIRLVLPLGGHYIKHGTGGP